MQPGALVAQNPNAANLNPNDLVISAIISNGPVSAGLIKNNTGTLQLTGNNTYTGPTTVNAGTLLVDGSQTGSTITVNAGAALGGIGTTGAIVVAGGRVNPGDPVTTTATLSGTSADFSNNGNLTVQMSGSSTGGISNDQLNLSGAATLGGTSSLTLDLNGLTTSTGGAITILQDASRTGQFTTVTLINNPLNLQAVLDYSSTTVLKVTLVAAPDHLAFAQQPTNTVAGVAISPAVTVQVLDQYNNLVITDTSNVTVAIGTNPGGGTLSGTTTVAAVGGVATFSTLSINKVGTGYTLTAADGSLTGATSGAFNITPAAADHLAFLQQPTNAVAGVAISPAVTVQVLDQFGNLVTSDTSNVTVAIGTNPGGGTLSGTTTVAAVGGIATFSTLSINKTGTGYTLTRDRRQPGRRHLQRLQHHPGRGRSPGFRRAADEHGRRRGDQPGGDGAGARPVRQPGDHRHLQRDRGHRHQPRQRHPERHDDRGSQSAASPPSAPCRSTRPAPATR